MVDAVTPEERWLPVVGWEGRYEVSDHGRVRSLDRPSTDSHPDRRKLIGGIVRGRILTPIRSGNWGHVKISLGGMRQRLVHRLVLEAFVGPCPVDMEACHNNGNASDNRLSNLRWDTHSENQYDKVRHGTEAKRLRTHCPRQHPLGDLNNVQSHAARGLRTCLACARARAYIHRYADLSIETDMQRIADAYYEAIMREAV